MNAPTLPPSKEQFAELVMNLEAAAELYGGTGGASAAYDLNKAREAIIAAYSAHEPPAGCAQCSNVAPIAKLAVRDGLAVRAGLYAPGLPDGDHDVYPAASSQPPGEGPESLVHALEVLRQRWSHNVSFEATIGACKEEIELCIARATSTKPDEQS